MHILYLVYNLMLSYLILSLFFWYLDILQNCFVLIYVYIYFFRCDMYIHARIKKWGCLLRTFSNQYSLYLGSEAAFWEFSTVSTHSTWEVRLSFENLHFIQGIGNNGFISWLASKTNIVIIQYIHKHFRHYFYSIAISVHCMSYCNYSIHSQAFWTLLLFNSHFYSLCLILWLFNMFTSILNITLFNCHFCSLSIIL